MVVVLMPMINSHYLLLLLLLLPPLPLTITTADTPGLILAI
jgi:hypothetical protein